MSVTLASQAGVCHHMLWAAILLLAASHLFVARADTNEQLAGMIGASEGELGDALEVILRANAARRRDDHRLGMRADPNPRTGSESNNKFMQFMPRSNIVTVRRVQRRPELVDLGEYIPLGQSDNVTVSAHKRAAEKVEQHEQEKGPQIAELSPPPPPPPPPPQKFFYVISPVSEQILPFQSERFAQGFKSLLPLPGTNYATGLRKLSSGGGEAGPRSWLLGSPFQRLEAASPLAASEPLGCRTTESSVQLTKDELEPASGRLVRRCSGRVGLNACEGSCASSIQPSVKSASGFTKVSLVSGVSNRPK